MHEANKNIKKWYTKSTWVDLQTGEEITKKDAIENYIISKKTIKYEIKYSEYNPAEQYGQRFIINECTRTGKQLRIW